jgi:ATP synthase protein I
LTTWSSLKKGDGLSRRDFLKEIDKESRRLKAGREGKKGIWRYLSSAVSVGWLVVIPALGGAYLGRYLDNRFNTGGYWTLSLMVAGLVAGIFWVWYSVMRGDGRLK